MKCTRICSSLANIILANSTLEGKVHSIFSSTINVVTDEGKIIAITRNRQGIVPYSIITDCENSFFELPIKQGERVLFRRDSVNFKKLYINLDFDLSTDLSLDMSSHTQFNQDFINYKLKNLKHFLMVNGNNAGMLSILSELSSIVKNGDYRDTNNNFNVILPALSKLLHAFIKRDYRNIDQLAKDIVGFGLGLTPSSDDFLCGMMAAFLYGSKITIFSQEYYLAIFKNMVTKIEGRTTIISENFLKNSSQGIFPLFIKELCVNLFSDESYDRDQFTKLLNGILSFGETSGTDILCGIYIGTTLIIDYFGGHKYEQ